MPRDPKPPKKYHHGLAHYAKIYGKSLRTIKRWAAAGKPLDDPDAMGEHFSPRGRKPAEDLDSAQVEEATRNIAGTPADPPRTERPAFDDARTSAAGLRTWDGDPVEPHLIALDETFFEGVGVLAAIERLQKAERERAAAYFAAIRSRSSTLHLQNRFKEWMGVVEALRKLEKDAPDIRKQNRLTIDRSEAEADIAQTFNALRAAINNLPPRAAAKLEGIIDRDEIEQILEREAEVLLRTLVDLIFAALEGEELPQRPADPADDSPTPPPPPLDDEP
ncbi:MAG TPA: hypothetical protein VGO11_19750 [Chthoniobacteraceae bacterium]|nr:hypothetical protein [Chthoniobacteraceae bacterium]